MLACVAQWIKEIVSQSLNCEFEPHCSQHESNTLYSWVKLSHNRPYTGVYVVSAGKNVVSFRSDKARPSCEIWARKAAMNLDHEQQTLRPVAIFPSFWIRKGHDVLHKQRGNHVVSTV